MNELVKHDFGDLAPELTEAEQAFLYQIEVLGLPVLRAAELAGINSPYYALKKPHMLKARDAYKNAVRGDVDFTRDDVVFGLKEAIDQARVLAEPMSQIAGWREIAKLKGYDKIPNINIMLTGTVEDMQKQLANMSTDKLLEIAGNNVLDTDFYRVYEDADADPS